MEASHNFHNLGHRKTPLILHKGRIYIAVPPSFIFSSYSITGTTPGYLTAMFGYPAWKLPSVSSYLKLPRSPWAILSVREGYILLFFNAFSYKLFNMIASKARFVKEFREFSESLKEVVTCLYIWLMLFLNYIFQRIFYFTVHRDLTNIFQFFNPQCFLPLSFQYVLTQHVYSY